MELQFSFLLITTFPLFLIFLYRLVRESKRYKSQNTNKRFPPGPWKLPFIGNLHHLIGSQPHHALRRLAERHGALMHIQLGRMSMLVVSSSQIAKEVMKTHDLAFATRPETAIHKILASNIIGREIALSPYGDYWRQMKKWSILELLSNKRVKSFSPIREREASNLIESIQSSTDSLINLTEKIFLYTSTVTCKAAFGNKCKDQLEFVSLTNEIISLAGGFSLAEIFPSLVFLPTITGVKAKLVKIHEKVNKILENIINEHTSKLMSRNYGKAQTEEEDLVDVLLRLYRSSSINDLELPISIKDVKAVIWGIFTGGTDTSSVTITWAMSEMMRNPGVMEKAQAEVREKLRGKKIINETYIQELSYLKLVIKETLRLHPPLPLLIPRQSREHCEINGYQIPIKTKLLVNAWAIGRDPDNWEDAESFLPERFSNSDIDFMGRDFEYIPFGAGRRICPGISFGVANIELPLAQLLYHFNWKLPAGIEPEELDMTEAFGAVAGRKNDLCLVATPYASLGDL